jgi:hypothetical protein
LRLYSVAASLRELAIKSKQNKSYSEVLREYENIPFQSEPHSVKGLRKLADIKEAMESIQQLDSDRNKAPYWGRNWLSQIGFDGSNFTATMTVGQWVCSRINLAHEFLEDARPC